jgi:hypothetical protein
MKKIIYLSLLGIVFHLPCLVAMNQWYDDDNNPDLKILESMGDGSSSNNQNRMDSNPSSSAPNDQNKMSPKDQGSGRTSTPSAPQSLNSQPIVLPKL